LAETSGVFLHAGKEGGKYSVVAITKVSTITGIRVIFVKLKRALVLRQIRPGVDMKKYWHCVLITAYVNASAKRIPRSPILLSLVDKKCGKV